MLFKGSELGLEQWPRNFSIAVHGRRPPNLPRTKRLRGQAECGLRIAECGLEGSVPHPALPIRRLLLSDF